MDRLIELQEISPLNLADAGRCDSSFWVTARLVLSIEAGQLRYMLASLAPYLKRYPPENVDYAAHIQHPDQTVYLAYLDGQLAGEIRLSRWWNGYASVEELAVNPACRRRGVGRALLERAQEWSRARQLAGVRLETQDINATACQLYLGCGFELSGFDRRLYSGQQPALAEIALYFYWPPSGA